MAKEIFVGATYDGEDVLIPYEAFRQHAAVFGGSGFGKTFFATILALEQMRQGASLVVLDPKKKGVHRMRWACQEAGLKPHQVQTVMASESQAAVGFDPLSNAYSPSDMASVFLTMFDRAGLDSGNRMRQFTTHAVRLAIFHGLKITQLVEVLLDKTFRNRLLSQPPIHPEDDAYRHTKRYFTERFDVYRESDLKLSVMAIDVALSHFEDSNLFLRMFNAPVSTLDFDVLFKEQRALLVHFGAGDGVHEQSGLFFASMVMQYLMSAAMRGHGNRPVVLMVDEFRLLSGFMAAGMRDIANMARELNIRLLVIAQHHDQIPEGMREDLMTSSLVKAYFNPGQGPVEPTARYLAMIAPPQFEPEEEDDEPDEEPEEEEEPDYSHVRSYHGKVNCQYYDEPAEGLQTLAVDDRYPAPSCMILDLDPDDFDGSVLRFLGNASPFAVPPLCLSDGRTVREVAEELPYGCVTLSWQNGQAFCHVNVPKPPRRKPARKVPQPKKPTVKPPTPYEFWAREMTNLEERQAVLLITGRQVSSLFVKDLDTRPDATTEFVRASLQAQSPYFKDGEFVRFIDDLKPPAPINETPEEIIEDGTDDSIA